MKRYVFLSIMACILCVGVAQAAKVHELTDSFAPFGTLHIYKASDHPDHVVLFISGDGGWNLGVVDMARSLARLDSMVVGIDITHYVHKLNARRKGCVYAAAQFEALSQYLQKKYAFPRYHPPVLVGYSSGATMVYTILAQSPANTFAGGISLGFCPDLKTKRPFCKGDGSLVGRPDPKLGFIYQTVDQLPSPWKVLQGTIDKVCYTPASKRFVLKVGNGDFIELPKVGHGFSVQRNWMPQFKEAFEDIVKKQQIDVGIPKSDSGVADLPLVELPGSGQKDTMVLIVSGDGGWASLDKQIGEALNRDGYPVVGLNSLQYFWSKKSPDIAGRDLERILTHYSRTWGVRHFALVGYSFGADTLPFMVSRIPESLKSKVKVVVLLGLERRVDFEFHLSDWISNGSDEPYRVIPEVQKLAGMHVMCVYGSDEGNSVCRELGAKGVEAVELPGGHHFEGNYAELADMIHARL